MDNNQVISQLTKVLRLAGQNIINGTAKFTISSNILYNLNSSLDVISDRNELITSPFHVTHNTNEQAESLRDLIYINNHIKQTKSLKLFSDTETDVFFINLSRFESIKLLEIYKVKVNTIKGMQKLRSQLQKLVCSQSCTDLNDILVKCGADNSQSHCWNELKEANFSHNSLVELGANLENIPWLHTLDISHNEINNVDSLNCLANLKYLNIAYNKLESIPQFKGQICNRIQTLIIKNNFLEDINGLQSLMNLCVLDLSNNCLIEHKALVSISHLATLQWLNLEGNPLSFHPNHRTQTVSYLHINTKTIRFMLDYVVLSKYETNLTNSLHPMQTRSYQNSVSNDPISSPSDKVRKVRVVKIEDLNSKPKPEIVLPTVATSSQHLDTKKQIEELREQYGEYWLNQHSGSLVQDVLGLEKCTLPPSSDKQENDLSKIDLEFPDKQNKEIATEYKVVEETVGVAETDNVFDIAKTPTSDDGGCDVDENDNDHDIELEGEESMYLATVDGETVQIFIVTTKTHITEQECSTSEERVRWHINSIIDCHVLDDQPNKVQLNFETMRKDRQQRIYVMELDEMANFLVSIKNILANRVIDRKKHIGYQCMKCLAKFRKPNSVLVHKQTSIECPKCNSTLVVEDF